METKDVLRHIISRRQFDARTCVTYKGQNPNLFLHFTIFTSAEDDAPLRISILINFGDVLAKVRCKKLDIVKDKLTT